jgi:hypothetical protein
LKHHCLENPSAAAPWKIDQNPNCFWQAYLHWKDFPEKKIGKTLYISPLIAELNVSLTETPMSLEFVTGSTMGDRSESKLLLED